MVMIALCSSLVGAVLGTRFKVFVLFPATMLGFAVIAAVAAFKDSAMASVILAATICSISLQAGYLGGLLTRFCMAAIRGVSPRSLRSTTVRS